MTPDDTPDTGARTVDPAGLERTQEVADRFRRVARGFTDRVEAVPPGRWDDPSPCDGWVARDVVGHLTGWMPPFFLDLWQVPRPDLPSVADDPIGAWAALRDALQTALDTPEVALRERETPLGRTLADAFDTGGVPDVLIHTWDLARAAGLDETLDPEEIARLSQGIEDMPFDAMEASGHYGPRVAAPAGADAQTRVLAAFGRTP